MSEIISQYGFLLLALGCLFSFFMAWGVGANDVANAMGTSVGARAITIKQAIVIAMIFEFAGAWLAGGEVTSTIRSGIIDIETAGFNERPELLVYGMLSSLLAAAIWLVVASKYGWPVSTTHSIIGAIIGFAMVGISVDSVVWSQVGSIVASWVISPLFSGVIAFGLFMTVQRLVLGTDDPFANAKKYVPFYMFLVGFVIAMVTLVKGLKHVGLELDYAQSSILAVIFGLFTTTVGVFMLRRIKDDPTANADDRFQSVERVFGVLMIFTACSMAFAHGSNDVANAIGPMSAIISVASEGAIGAKSAVSPWVLLIGGVGIVFGLAMLGGRVIKTVGSKITTLTPSLGFSAEMAAASTVVAATYIGFPISTTHTLVGAVIGVGLAKGVSHLDLSSIGRIILSWVVTIPAGATLTVLFYVLLRFIETLMTVGV